MKFATAVLISTCVMLNARDLGTTATIPELMAEAKAQAIQLRADAAAMESFDRMPVLCEFQSIKGRAHDAEALAAKLEEAIPEAYPWQKAAIRRVVPVLRELAENTADAVEYVEGNAKFAGSMEFAQFVGAHFDGAVKLTAIVEGLVDYSAFMDRYRIRGN